MGGGGVKDVERSDDGFMEFFGAAAEDDVLAPEANLVVGGADRLESGGARGGGGGDDALDAEILGDVQGDRVGDAAEEFGGSEHFVFVFGEKGFVGLRDGLGAAGGGAHDAAEAEIFGNAGGVDAGVPKGLDRRPGRRRCSWGSWFGGGIAGWPWDREARRERRPGSASRPKRFHDGGMARVAQTPASRLCIISATE